MGDRPESDSQRVVNVSRFLRRMALSQPELTALKVPRERTAAGEIDYLSLSSAQLEKEQDEWAKRFRAQGIESGSRVLLMVRPGLPLIAICFALFKIGAVPVVIDPGMGLSSFLKCVRRSKPEFLVGISPAIWASRIFFGSFRSLKAKVKVGGPLECISNANTVAMDSAPSRASDLAAILFTSGSTGAPKGVCYEHGMFEAQVFAIKERYEIEPGEVDLPMLPVFALFNPAMGMTTVVPEINPSKPATVDPAKIVQAIQQCEVTNSFGSPALWKKIGIYCEQKRIQLPSLRRILMAGAPVPPQVMAQFRKILPYGKTHSPYGATEVLPVSSVVDDQILGGLAERTERGEGTCVGKPLDGVEVRILPIEEGDMSVEDLGRKMDDGEIGEIVATGPSVTKSYDALPEATRLAKILEGDRVWHRMGDLGYFDKEGLLWFCGRKAERVISESGVFYSDCCEGVFNTHPDVFRSALIKVGGKPAIAIEPMPDKYPKTEYDSDRFVEVLRELGASSEVTSGIESFYFKRSFPVDVRHNAKIHRLTLSEEFDKLYRRKYQ
ncbi:MAG: AMP-binding protein [Symploca sp. SIO2D2]|nr:AMP-binding protein [Symploca sp. SIO2D2]